MQAGVKIAISGKGGVGKTTVCAVWAKVFAEDGFDVLAIDADSNSNLASAFGISSENSPQPLIKFKDLIAERTGTDKTAVGAYFRLNPRVSDLPEQYWLEVDGVKLLVLGDITAAAGGCACPEGAFLKAMLSHIILQRQEVVLVDLAAGVEFMGRASVQGTDVLVVVVEPGARSIETANNIATMAKQLGISRVAAIANKITRPEQSELIRARLSDMVFLCDIEYDPALAEADLHQRSVFETDIPAVVQLRRAKEKLMNFVYEGVRDGS